MFVVAKLLAVERWEALGCPDYPCDDDVCDRDEETPAESVEATEDACAIETPVQGDGDDGKHDQETTRRRTS